jgi:hypothetical protein
MARSASKWPDDLGDAAAVERLESIMISACDGVRELGRDRAYKAFRKRLLAREDLADFVPSIVTTHNDLDSFVSSVKNISDREERRERVRNSFQAIRSTLGDPEFPAIESRAWTGRPSAAQQAAIVKALALPALGAVEKLLRDQEDALDNGGPVDADREKALTDLRELHTALGELVRLIETDRPIDGILARLAALKDRAIAGFVDNLRKDASALHGTASTVIVGVTTIGITQLLTGSEVAAAALGAMAGSAFPKLRTDSIASKAQRSR